MVVEERGRSWVDISVNELPFYLGLYPKPLSSLYPRPVARRAKMVPRNTDGPMTAISEDDESSTKISSDVSPQIQDIILCYTGEI